MDQHLKELQQIRGIMERSGRFLSLSGASGILAGTYAIAGAFVFARLNGISVFDPWERFRPLFWDRSGLAQAAVVALVVLLLSVGTGLLMSFRKARKSGATWYSGPARMLVVNLALPLAAGGAVAFIMAWHGWIALVPGLILVFYGLALFAGSRYTYSDIKFLGLAEILLGLMALLWYDYGFLSWVIGFGLFHILYGTIMYLRNERPGRQA